MLDAASAEVKKQGMTKALSNFNDKRVAASFMTTSTFLRSICKAANSKPTA
jgi:hypothetical protein